MISIPSFDTGGILRAAIRFAYTADFRRPLGLLVRTCLLATLTLIAGPALALDSPSSIRKITELDSILWNFGRSDDKDFNDWPDGWQKYEGIGYPQYVEASIKARDPEAEQRFLTLDTGIVRAWQKLNQYFPSLPSSPPSLPPPVIDALVDRYLRVVLDGGKVKVQTTRVAISRLYQYRFTCEIMTRGLRYDTAYAELVFLDKAGNEIAAHATEAIGGTTQWKKVQVDRLRPPIGAETAIVRLVVQGSEDGLEDIRGTIGFDNLRIQQYPQLQVTTNEPLGIYNNGQPIEVRAKVLGLPVGASRVRFRLFSYNDEELATRVVSVDESQTMGFDQAASTDLSAEGLSWRLPRLENGYYRVTAMLEGNQAATLSAETTLAVIDRLVDGPPHGSFGWTVPDGNEGIRPRDFAAWLAKLGVAWVKYPCWLAPEDYDKAEEVATIFSKLQDAGIQTVGMLDMPPADHLAPYQLRGRRNMVAARLFRDESVWQPLLEPVMTRLTLKVRTWQLGADGDHSFLGLSRLRESIKRISTGLQGFGQPIDVAISWPWLEPQLEPGESSWQAICRSSDPPLGARELDAFLSLNEFGSRGEGPRTWLLLNPASASNYSRESRIRDLVLRMATVRSHRVQATFVSNPRDAEQGLLRPDGRPGELLLPWRTTSRLIGNLRQVGSLQLRSGAANSVFVGSDRAVLMVWSAKPTEELMYLGEDAQSVDVWGRITKLPLEQHDGQSVQRIAIGPVPTFIIGADPTILAFRMSVDLDRNHLDSLLGQIQKLAVTFTNPIRDGMVGDLQVIEPESWTIESPKRSWETLGGRSSNHSFNVVLGNSAKIGTYELPIRFDIESVPPVRITVYRKVDVGPDGLDLKVNTRLSRNSELRVQIEMTNRSLQTQSYDCMLFPPPGRQYQRRFLTIKPGETIRREIYWPDGQDLVGQKMLLRAIEQDGQRVVNYSIDVTR